MRGQNTSSAVMAQRKEAPDSIDYYPTPPWGTRALCDIVLGGRDILQRRTAWDPCCGEGDMTRPLIEYFWQTTATDIFDYGYGGMQDFLSDDPAPADIDWIVMNPPFNAAEAFIKKALSIAEKGVAVFGRINLLEGLERYNEIFAPFPLWAVCPFSERIGLWKGRLNRKGTSTMYAWFVWRKGWQGDERIIRIPPGTKARLDRPEDWRRAGINADPLPLMDAAAE